MMTEETVWPKVIAVTGGSGFVGRRLLPLLLQTPSEIRVLTRKGQSCPSACVPITGGLGDAAATQELVTGADAVIHLAGIAHTDLRDAAQRAHAYSVNVEGTKRLVQVSQAAHVSQFLYVSSAHVYAGQQGVRLTEHSPTSPDGAYASMKLEAEQVLQQASQEGMYVTVLRPCLIYGPGARHNLQLLMRAIYRGRFVTALGARTERSMASVDTVTAAIVHLLGRPDQMGLYNVADREPVILEQWVRHLASLLGVKPPPSVPPALLHFAAALGSAAAAFALPAPLTRTTLSKLTAPFSLDVTHLAATGFVWPQDHEAVLQEMLAAEFPALSLTTGRD